MLSKIKSYIQTENKDRVIYDGEFKVIQTADDKYRFIPIRSNSSLKLRIGDKKLALDKELEFSSSVKENICVLSHNQPEFYIGDNYSNKSVNLFFTKDQIDSIRSIKFSGCDIFSNNTDYLYSVTKLQDIWCISITGFLEKMPYNIDINLGFGYPSIQLYDDYDITNNNYNLHSINKRTICVDVPNPLQGKISIDNKSFNLDKYRCNEHSLSDINYNKIYVFDDTLEEEIKKWNNHKVTVTVMPENYIPKQKEKDLNEDLTNVSFDISEFDKLAEINAEYPKNVEVNPRIVYDKPICNLDIVPDGIQKSIYKQYVTKKESDRKQVFKFKSVIPSKKLTVVHSSGIGSDFDDFGECIDIRSGENKELCIEPEPRKIHFRVKNDTNSAITVSINKNTEYLQQDELVNIEAELYDKNNIIEFQDSSGEIIKSKTIGKYDAMALSETTVTDF